MKTFLNLSVIFMQTIFFSGCSQSPTKENSVFMTIEEKSCQSCYRCLTEFKCPKEAISIDTNRKAVIDPQKCIGCKLCVTDFKCPYQAIKVND